MPAPIPEKAADTTKSVLMDIPVTFAYNITQDESGGYSIIEDTSKKDSPPQYCLYLARSVTISIMSPATRRNRN